MNMDKIVIGPVGTQGKTVISTEEYRQLMNDQQSTDELIIRRMQFMEALCRNVIRIELEKVRHGSKG